MKESERAAAIDHTNQYGDKCNDQKDVNESTDGIRGNEAEEPEDEQNNGNGIKHFFLSRFKFIVVASELACGAFM
jgi:hypothetical protein